MKVTCPVCSTHYSIAAERLEGRKVKVRCKKCGEAFPVDERRRARDDADLFAGVATAGADDSDAATNAGSTPHATPLTGGRNESSVLFSLATLAKHAPSSSAEKITESSAMIDIRALMSASSPNDAATSRADDIVNLSGGGAFALLAPPVTFAPAEESKAARRRYAPLVIGALALATALFVGVAAIASTRAKVSVSTAPNTPSATTTSISNGELIVPVHSGAVVASAEAINPAPPNAQIALVLSGKTNDAVLSSRTTSHASHTSDAKVVAPQPTAALPQITTNTVVTASATPKCCPGESDTTCHMRLSVGAACGAEPAISTSGSAPPFDRVAAARALGITMTSCKRADGPTGAGHARVTFQPSGSVSTVDIDAPYYGTSTGACVAQRYRATSVPAFSGSPLSVGKTFIIE